MFDYINVIQAPLFLPATKPLSINDYVIENDVSSPKLSSVKLVGIHSIASGDLVECFISNVKYIGFVDASDIDEENFITEVKFNATPVIFNNLSLNNEHLYEDKIEFIEYDLIQLYITTIVEYYNLFPDNYLKFKFNVSSQLDPFYKNFKVSKDVKSLNDLISIMLINGIRLTFQSYRSNGFQYIEVNFEPQLKQVPIVLNDPNMVNLTRNYGEEEWNILILDKVETINEVDTIVETGIFYLKRNMDLTTTVTTDKNDPDRVFPLKPPLREEYKDNLSLLEFAIEKANSIKFQNEISFSYPTSNKLYIMNDIHQHLGRLITVREDKYYDDNIVSVLSYYKITSSPTVELKVGLSRNKNYAKYLERLITGRS